jgi:hypothetical protein
MCSSNICEVLMMFCWILLLSPERNAILASGGNKANVCTAISRVLALIFCSVIAISFVLNIGEFSAAANGKWVYFLAFLLLAIGSVFAFGGRPTGATSLILLKSSSVYRASCENGLHPARRSRLLTVSRGSLSFSAISEIVIPFMPYIIGILTIFLKFVRINGQILNNRIGKFAKS